MKKRSKFKEMIRKNKDIGMEKKKKKKMEEKEVKEKRKKEGILKDK